jgi:protein-disulfide isomerase
MKDESAIIKLAPPVNESDHILGPQTAPATLVEYGDYECPFCRQLHPIIKEIMKRTEGLRFVYRHFPISNVHPYAVRAAEAAEAAGAQGRFWEMHDALFALDQPLDDEHLSRSARKAGLDMQRYAREMSEGAYTKIVNDDFNTALFKGGVTGTPTLYLNGEQLSSIHDMEVLLGAVTEAGATVYDNSHERAGWLSRLRNFRGGMTRLRLF